MTPIVLPTIYTVVDKTIGPLMRMQSRMDSVSKTALNISAKAAIGAAAIAAPMALVVDRAIQFEDRMADIAKTTGLQGKALENLGSQLLDLSKKTRTPLADLQKIAEIGGQMGVAEDQLLSFVESANKFTVALGSDFSGGTEEAISQVSKLQSLFRETRKITVGDAITRAGSVINELGAIGNGTSANITDFALRIGALPDAFKPSIESTMALGAVFEESGVMSEVAARGFSNLVQVAGKNVAGFAQQMHLSEKAAKDLLAIDPTAFTSRFAASFEGVAPDVLAKKLDALGVGAEGTIKVVGALASHTDRLTELQGVANKSFADGTSLTNEYNKKNETTAAKLAIAKNNFEALAITIGTRLLPVISQIIDKVMPVIDSVMKWVETNPELTQTLLVVTGALWGMLTVTSAIAAIVAAVASPIGAVVAVLAALAVGVYLVVEHWETWGKWIILLLGPLGFLIRLVVEIIQHWETWGKYVALLLGPLGMVITLIKSIGENWDMIKRAFTDGGIMEGFKAIGAVLFDMILTPLKTILEIAANLPGKMGRWAQEGADAIERYRGSLGLAVHTQTLQEKWQADNAPYPMRYEAVNPKTAQNDALVQQMLQVSGSQNVGITINDKTGRADVKNTGNIVPVNVTRSNGQINK